MICQLPWPAKIVSVLLGLLTVLTTGFADPSQLWFRLPEPVPWSMEEADSDAGPPPGIGSWLTGRRSDDRSDRVTFGSRIVLQTTPGTRLEPLLAGGRAHLSRVLPDGVWILQAPNARTAAIEAHRLAQLSGVRVSYPVMRQELRLHGPYARLSNDRYFDRQWYLENRASDGTPVGVDLNVRAAWPLSLGADVTIAIVDDGVELTHPEFERRAHHDLHFNFGTGTTNGLPSSLADNHATAVAGLHFLSRSSAASRRYCCMGTRVRSDSFLSLVYCSFVRPIVWSFLVPGFTFSVRPPGVGRGKWAMDSDAGLHLGFVAARARDQGQFTL